jgi:ribosomal protein S18 acetylase RimI-like enzyme
MTDVTIRRAGLADLDAVIELLADTDALHREALPWLFQQTQGAHWNAFLEPFVTQADRVMFVAVAADAALAGVTYLLLRPPARAPIVKPAIVAELDSLAVNSAFRRQRIGTRLVEAALAWAKAAGAARTELSVYEFNEPARAFWASFGFETVSRRLVRNETKSQ